ncbi:hypothetical protein H5410_030628, partial [Solanum commersonii]
CLKICYAKDHSTQLVGIADALGDSPFGLFHHLLALAFSLFSFWVVGQYGTSLRNYSVTRRQLHFIANLIFPFRAQRIGTKGDLQSDWRLATWGRRYSGTHFCVLVSRLVPFSQFKKDVSNSATQDSIMNVHNKTQLTHARINCILKDSSCDTPLPMIPQAHYTCFECKFELNKGILMSSHKERFHIHTQWFNPLKFWNQMQHSLSQRITQCMLSPIGLSVFSNQQLLQLTQDQKGFSRLVMGLSVKSQQDAKSSHIDYVTLLGLIVAAHSYLFDYEHNSIHRGPVGAVSRDCRYTRRSAFWSISSPSCFSHKPLHILGR